MADACTRVARRELEGRGVLHVVAGCAQSPLRSAVVGGVVGGGRYRRR